MSLPNIPDIAPLITLTRQEVIHLLLSSIAMEEISLSHIMNAEGEKIQYLLQGEDVCLGDMLALNKSVERMLRGVVKNQILLHYKLEDIIEMDRSYRRDDCYEEPDEE